MKLSMKSRYGLRALIDLAINSKTRTGGAQQHCRAEQDISTVSGTGICKS